MRDVSPEQVRAWSESVPWLQSECRELIRCHPAASSYSAVLEYELPYEFRRPDVIVLADGPVVVMELKSTAHPTQAALDQVAAYARDLRCYHASCAGRDVRAILVPALAGPEPLEIDGVTVVGPAGVHQVVQGMVGNGSGFHHTFLPRTETAAQSGLDVDDGIH